MEKIEALKKIGEAKNFREACWAIDDIAKETKDKKILLEVFNISEKLAEDFNDFRNLAERIQENIKDKKLTLKSYQKLETKIKEFDDYVNFAECLIDNLKDKKWAIKIYKKAENIYEEDYEAESLASSILSKLKDKKWEKLIKDKISNKQEDNQSKAINEVKKTDTYKLIGQEITIFSKLISKEDFKGEQKTKKSLSNFVKESESLSSSYPVIGILENNKKNELREKSELLNNSNINVNFDIKNKEDLFKKPPKDKILLVYYYQYLSTSYNLKFKKDIKNLILDTSNFNNLAILRDNSKQYTFELEESDKASETYICAILPNGKIIEETLKDKNKIIKKLSK